MSSIKKFISLEFNTIKPYITFRNLAVFAGISLIMGISMKNASALGAVLIFMGITFVSYLFAVGEQNGIDTLYMTLPISRNDVVLGRYVFVALIFTMLTMFSIIMSIFAANIMKSSMSAFEIIISSVDIGLVFYMVSMIQLPIFFKMGYMKGKSWVYLPQIIIAVVAIGMGGFFSKIAPNFGVMPEIFKSDYFVAATFAIIYCLAVVVSYRLSKKFYNNRDF